MAHSSHTLELGAGRALEAQAHLDGLPVGRTSRIVMDFLFFFFVMDFLYPPPARQAQGPTLEAEVVAVLLLLSMQRALTVSRRRGSLEGTSRDKPEPAPTSGTDGSWRGLGR